MYARFTQHISASGCHLQGVVGALEATQVISVLWMYVDYDSSVCTLSHLSHLH
jgi:hypothetical protein